MSRLSPSPLEAAFIALARKHEAQHAQLCRELGAVREELTAVRAELALLRRQQAAPRSGGEDL
jgi:hypothetical protein